MASYLGEDVSVAQLEALVAAYGGRQLRPVSPRYTALVVRYLSLRGVTTRHAAQRLGFEDAMPNAEAVLGDVPWLA